MKSKINKIIWILLLSVVILCGCAALNVDIVYRITTSKKSPLSTIKPMRIELQVEDQRNPNEQDRLGERGPAKTKVISNKEVTVVLHDALKSALNNNGHNVIDIKEGQSDVIIHVRLKRYWSDRLVHFWELEMRGTISADITILNPQNDSVLFSKTISSTFSESRQLATSEAYESALNGALAEFIRNFSRNPGILKTLRLIVEQVETSGSSFLTARVAHRIIRHILTLVETVF